MTVTGIMGTPAYMAPEQAQGQAVDHRADIYALGLILYEIFAGSTAFKGDTPMAVALKHIHETPPAPREVERALPAHVERAILKCLEKNPAKRFQSVDELARALTEEAEHPPEVEAAEVVHVPAHLAFWQRSDWALAGAAVLGTILFFILFYRFHPASAMEITVNGEQAKAVVREALKRVGAEAQVGESDLWYWSDDYYAGALSAGLRPAHEFIARTPLGLR